MLVVKEQVRKKAVAGLQVAASYRHSSLQLIAPPTQMVKLYLVSALQLFLERKATLAYVYIVSRRNCRKIIL